jgi:hypothetical protein
MRRRVAWIAAAASGVSIETVCNAVIRAALLARCGAPGCVAAVRGGLRSPPGAAALLPPWLQAVHLSPHHACFSSAAADSSNEAEPPESGDELAAGRTAASAAPAPRDAGNGSAASGLTFFDEGPELQRLGPDEQPPGTGANSGSGGPAVPGGPAVLAAARQAAAALAARRVQTHSPESFGWRRVEGGDLDALDQIKDLLRQVGGAQGPRPPGRQPPRRRCGAAGWDVGGRRRRHGAAVQAC